MLVLAQRTSLAAIGVVLCSGPEPDNEATCEVDGGPGVCSAGACEPDGAGGSGGNGGGGTGGSGGTTQVLEDCTNDDDDDEDALVDCQDVSDCACAPNCIDLFLAAVASEACVSPDPPNLLTSPGFEAYPANWTEGWGFPQKVELWGGDLAAVVGTDLGLGVVPLEGGSMMQFTSTDSNPLPTKSSSSERVQLIAADSYLGRRLCGVASFARIAGDGQTDSAFAVVTAWYDGSPGDFDAFTSSITSECFGADENFRCGNGPLQIAQSDASKWFRTSSTTVLPTVLPMPTTGVATALVMVRAQENVCNDGSVPGDPDFCPDEGPELDGHFVDDVGLFLVPDPPSKPCIDAMAPPP